jgi:hypothetical protein
LGYLLFFTLNCLVPRKNVQNSQNVSWPSKTSIFYWKITLTLSDFLNDQAVLSVEREFSVVFMVSGVSSRIVVVFIHLLWLETKHRNDGVEYFDKTANEVNSKWESNAIPFALYFNFIGPHWDHILYFIWDFIWKNVSFVHN